MCTIAHTEAFLERPVEDFDRLRAEIKRLEGLVEGRDAEIEQLTHGWNASIAELEEERTWREGLSDLSISQQLEIERLKAALAETREVLRQIRDTDETLRRILQNAILRDKT